MMQCDMMSSNGGSRVEPCDLKVKRKKGKIKGM